MFLNKDVIARGPPLNGQGRPPRIHLGVVFRWLRRNYSNYSRGVPPSKLTFFQFVEEIKEEFSFDIDDLATRALILFAWAVIREQTRKNQYGSAWYVTDDEDGLRFYLFSQPHLSHGIKTKTEERVKKLTNLDPDKIFHARCSRCGTLMPLVGIAAMRPALRGHLFIECGMPGVERVDMEKLKILVDRAWEAQKGGQDVHLGKLQKTG